MTSGAYQLGQFFQSQLDAARRLGISVSYLSDLLNGQQRPSIEVAAAIEREFGIPCRAWAEEIRKGGGGPG